MDKYRVTLTAEERADLEQLVSRGKAAARKLTAGFMGDPGVFANAV